MRQYNQIIEELSKQIETMTLQLNEIQTTVSKTRTSSEDKDFQKKFSLPESEYPITCTDMSD